MGAIYSLMMTAIMAFSVDSEVPYTAIQQAFENGNAKSITAMSKEKVLINILGKEGVYSKAQASLVLKNFFSANPCSEFAFFFKGKEMTDGTFAIGTYNTKSSEYRVTVHLKRIGDGFKIESLVIEKP